MKTIVLEKPGKLIAVDSELPGQPARDEALVRVHRVGICGTDMHAFRGKQPFFTYPRILGHELGVEVIALESNAQDVSVGDRCAIEPYLNCGECIACRRDKPNCCVNLKVLGVHTDGGMREFIRVPTSKLHRSRTLSFDQLALVETLGIGAHAVDRAQLQKGESVLVIGAGPIGLSVIQFAVEAGVRTIVLDVNEKRLAFCREQMKVHLATRSIDEVKTALSGELPTAVFDATGNPQSMAKAFEYVAHGGRLVFVGLFIGDVTFHDPEFHRREMTLLASRNSTSADFRRIITLIETARIDTGPWITHRATSNKLIELFPGWLEPDAGVIKAMVEF